MPSRAPDVIALIRLRQGSLPQALGMQLRDQLANDAQLRRRWGQLVEHLDSPRTPGFSADISAEVLAAFVDDWSNPNERQVVEQLVWSHPGVAQEVASICLARFDPPQAHTIPAGMLGRLQNSLRDQLASDHDFHVLSGSDEDAHDAAGSTMTNGRTMSVAAGETSPPSQYASDLHTFSPHRLVAASVLLAAALGGFWLLSNHRSEPAGMTTPTRHLPTRANDTAVAPVVRRELTAPRVEETVTPPPSPTVAPDPVAVVPATSHDRPVEPLLAPDAAPSPAETVAMAVNWERVSGLLLRQAPHTRQWQGIDVPVIVDAGELHLMTLPRSWAEGNLAAGPRITLDADTQVKLSTRPDKPATTHVSLTRGRVALQQFRGNETIVLQQSEVTLPVRIDDEATAIGLTDGSFGSELHVLAGSVTLNRTRITEGFGVLLEDESFAPRRLPTPAAAWRHRPDRPFPLQHALVQTLLRSDDVLATLDEWDDPTTQLLANRLALTIDPQVRVPRQAVAATETERIAAIEWLLHAPAGDDRAEDVWNQLDSGPLSQSTVDVRSWFELLRQPRTLTVVDLQQLVAGLTPQQPVFTRQMAIYTLRQILARPLREYSADQPTRAGISAVTQQVRQFQNRRRLP